MPLNKLLACSFLKCTFQDRQYLSEVYCSICTTVTETHSDSESELKLQKIIKLNKFKKSYKQKTHKNKPNGNLNHITVKISEGYTTVTLN